MTGKQFVRDVRDYLGDVPERSSTPNLFWESDEILETASIARDTLVRNVWLQQRSHKQPFSLTLTNCIKTLHTPNAVNPLPTDFWKALCCLNNAGGYVPVEINEEAPGLEGYGEVGADYAYIAGGNVLGNTTAFSAVFDTLVYVALPSVAMTESDTKLTDFSESFYESLELLTCISLLGKRERGALDPQGFLARETARAMATLI